MERNVQTQSGAKKKVGRSFIFHCRFSSGSGWKTLLSRVCDRLTARRKAHEIFQTGGQWKHLFEQANISRSTTWSDPFVAFHSPFSSLSFRGQADCFYLIHSILQQFLPKRSWKIEIRIIWISNSRIPSSSLDRISKPCAFEQFWLPWIELALKRISLS